nr:pyridoxal-phosphate dependent enzyme [Nitrospirota bacterium]
MDDVTFADIQRAAERLRGIAHVTPVMTGRQLDEASGATAFLKCENFQRVGAFKFRGAYHAILMHPPEERGRPIVTISSGTIMRKGSLWPAGCWDGRPTF